MASNACQDRKAKKILWMAPFSPGGTKAPGNFEEVGGGDGQEAEQKEEESQISQAS